MTRARVVLRDDGYAVVYPVAKSPILRAAISLRGAFRVVRYRNICSFSLAFQMQVFNLGAEMIVAGVDDTGARVAHLGNPARWLGLILDTPRLAAAVS